MLVDQSFHSCFGLRHGLEPFSNDQVLVYVPFTRSKPSEPAFKILAGCSPTMHV